MWFWLSSLRYLKLGLSVHKCQIKSQTVLSEVEKYSFIALPGKGRHTIVLFPKVRCLHPREFDEQDLQALNLISVK